MSNNDDWCYLDSGSERSPSFDVEEPEIEMEPMYVEEICTAKRVDAATSTKAQLDLLPSTSNQEDTETEELDVLSLLSDNKSTNPYPRDTMLSLLSPAHQRYVTTGKPRATPSSRKRSVREAFVVPSQRVHEHPPSTYADRLRAVMPSRKTLVDTSQQVEMTDVKRFACEQGTQTDADNQPARPDHAGLLSSALERSLNLSVQLKTKSQDAEKLDIRTLKLQLQLDERTRERDAIVKELHTAQRGLRISRKRSELTDEFQDHLKRQIEQLRQQNGQLQQRVEVLAGGLDLESKSVSELERLEDAVSDAMSKIRLALRVKYHQAINGEPADVNNQTEDASGLCVVCMEKLACVRVEPCGHEVLCSQCSVRVETCPIDRQPIRDQIMTHGLNAYGPN